MEDQLDQAELDALWKFDDPMASAERFAIAASEPRRSELVRAELETQRARALGLQARFAEADALLESLEPAFGRLAVRILLERGRLRNTEGLPEESIALFEEALNLARLDDELFLAVDAAHMLAVVDASRSEQWTEEAFADLGRTEDPRTLRWGVALHNNRGWMLFEAGRPAEALGEFEAAVEDADRYGTADQQFAAQWALGRCLREVGRVAIVSMAAPPRPRCKMYETKAKWFVRMYSFGDAPGHVPRSALATVRPQAPRAQWLHDGHPDYVNLACKMHNRAHRVSGSKDIRAPRFFHRWLVMSGLRATCASGSRHLGDSR